MVFHQNKVFGLHFESRDSSVSCTSRKGRDRTPPKIFRWQNNGLEGLPVLFLVAKYTTLYLREENIRFPVPERGEH